uniref:CARD domain-containing protein n=1 Tax=Plectus sambesii TaxID=2011161 RepID=A0A914W812_9BILA
MDKQKQLAIEHYKAALMDSMHPLSVMDNLCAGLLSVVEQEFIKESQTTRRDRNRELISILFRKREELEPFEHFIQALKKTDTNHEILAKDILQTYKHDNDAAVLQNISRTSDAEETNYDLQM